MLSHRQRLLKKLHSKWSSKWIKKTIWAQFVSSMSTTRPSPYPSSTKVTCFAPLKPTIPRRSNNNPLGLRVAEISDTRICSKAPGSLQTCNCISLWANRNRRHQLRMEAQITVKYWSIKFSRRINSSSFSSVARLNRAQILNWKATVKRNKTRCRRRTMASSRTHSQPPRQIRIIPAISITILLSITCPTNSATTRATSWPAAMRTSRASARSSR